MAPSRGPNSSGHAVYDSSKARPAKVPSARREKRVKSKIKTESTLGAASGRTTAAQTTIDPTLQQAILDCFRHAFPALLSPTGVGSDLPPLIQEVKAHLYKRDFETAFCGLDYQKAYAVRWSASRALGYLQILNDLDVFLNDQKLGGLQSLAGVEPLVVACLGGGGGAELCAFAGLYRLLGLNDKAPALSIEIFDVADWTSVITALGDLCCQSLSSPVSSSTSTSSVGYTNYTQDVLLDVPLDAFSRTHLITIMFTLNELYTTSQTSTQTLLLDITNVSRPGTLLLVVDSPGSYSTVTLNGREKQYPMAWLLHHTLTKVAPDIMSAEKVKPADEAAEKLSSTADEKQKSPDADEARPVAVWERLMSDESRWFRLPKGLVYPIDLENMRYQIHLYRRV